MPNLPDAAKHALRSSEGSQRGSIDERMRRAAQSAADRVVIVQDISGSMADTMPGSSTSRVEVSKQAASQFIDASDRRLSAIGIVVFDDYAKLITPPVQHYPTVRSGLQHFAAVGGTSFNAGIRCGLAASPTRLILISDGQSQDDWKKSAHSAKLAGIPIDCIFIGADDEPGAATMRQIAELTGGHFFSAKDMNAYIASLVKLEFRNRLQLEHKTS